MTSNETKQLVLDRLKALEEKIEASKVPAEAISALLDFEAWVTNELSRYPFDDADWMSAVLVPRLHEISEKSELSRLAMSANTQEKN